MNTIALNGINVTEGLLKDHGISLRERGKSTQVSFRKDGKRVQKQRKTLQEAVEFAIAELGITLQPTLSSREPVGDLWNLYQETLSSEWSAPSVVSLNTRKSSVTALTRFFDHFGKKINARDISDLSIKRFESTLRNRGLAQGTLNLTFSKIAVVFKKAVEAGLMDNIPKLPKRKAKEKDVYVYSFETEAEMVSWCHSNDESLLADFITLGLYTCMRKEELRDITKRHVVMHEGEALKLNLTSDITKNNKPRTLTLRGEAKTVVTRLYKQSKGSLFEALGSASTLDSKWGKMREALELPSNADRHAMRHTGCTRLVDAKLNPYDIMTWMGHSDLKIVMTYIHRQNALEEATADFESYLNKHTK